MFDNVHLKINYICLIVTGVAPLKLKGRLKFLNVVHTIYSLVILCYFALFVLSEIIEVFNIIGGNIFELVSNLGVSLLYSVCIVKIFVCRSQSIADLLHQIHDKEKRIFHRQNDKVQDIYMKNVKVNYGANKLLIWVGVVTIAPFYFSPLLAEWQNPPEKIFNIIENSTIVYIPRPLPFSSWFPFDRFKYYYVSYACHILAGTCGASLTVTTDILFYGLMLYAIGQIKILQHYVKEFKIYSKSFANHNTCSHEEAIYLFVGKCVKEHKIIIK